MYTILYTTVWSIRIYMGLPFYFNRFAVAHNFAQANKILNFWHIYNCWPSSPFKTHTKTFLYGICKVLHLLLIEHIKPEIAYLLFR